MVKPKTTPKKRTSKTTAAKKTAIPRAAATAPDARSGVSAELTQLAEIRAKFAPLSEAEAAAMYARHTDAQCRDRAVTTKAAETFRGAMSWARTLGAHHGDPAIHRKRARWFLDCLTALGAQLDGRTVRGNPAFQASFDDAERRAQRLVTRVARKLQDAVGHNAKHLALIDEALAERPTGHRHANRAYALAKLIRTWSESADRPPMDLFDIDGTTAAELERSASEIDALIARKPEAQLVDRDGPETNIAEGRLLFAMRTLWNDASDAREDLRSNLQFTVSPAIARGLNLRRTKKESVAANE